MKLKKKKNNKKCSPKNTEKQYFIFYKVFQFMCVMKHVRVVDNMCDTPDGPLNERVHQNGLLSLFNMPQCEKP